MTNEHKDDDRPDILGLTGDAFSEPDVVAKAPWSIRQRLPRDTVLEQSRDMRSNKCLRTMADEESGQSKVHVALDKAYADTLRKEQENKRQTQRTSNNTRSPTKQQRVNIVWKTRVITVVEDDTVGEQCEFFAAVLFPAATRQAVMTGRTQAPDTSQITLKALLDHIEDQEGWTSVYVWFQDGEHTYVINSDDRLRRAIDIHDQKQRSIRLHWSTGEPGNEQDANVSATPTQGQSSLTIEA